MFKMVKKIFGATCVLSIASVVEKASTFLLVPILTKVLTPSEYGELTAALSVGSFFLLLVLNGQNSSVFRWKSQWQHAWSFDVFEKAIVGLCYFSFVILLAFLMGTGSLSFFDSFLGVKPDLLTLVVAATSIYVAIQIKMSIWTATRAYKNILLISSIRGSAVIAGCYGIIQFYPSVFVRPGVELLLGVVFLLALTFFYVRTYPALSSVPRKELQQEVLESFRYGWIIQLSQLAFWVLNSSDRIMLNKLYNAEEAAFYAILMTAMLPIFFIGNFSNVVSAHYYQIWMKEKKHSNLDILLSQFISVGVVLGVLYKVFLYFFATDIILLISGSAYLRVAPLMCFVPDILFFYLLYLAMTRYFHAEGLKRIIFGVSFGAAVINVVINFYFIPKFGAVAALISSISAYALTSLMAAGCLIREVSISSYKKTMFTAFISICLMVIVDWVLLVI